MNNVYVSSVNHSFDPNVYIDAIPAERVVQYHLAGHTHKGTHILDTHSDHALPEVWELYRRAWARTGPTATLYEWDEDIPAFDVVHAEAKKALAHRGEAILPDKAQRKATSSRPCRPRSPDERAAPSSRSPAALDAGRHRPSRAAVDEARPGTAAHGPGARRPRLADVILPSTTLRPEERLGIYHGMYPLRMRDALAGDYPGLEHFLGEEGFARFVARLRPGASLAQLHLEPAGRPRARVHPPGSAA